MENVGILRKHLKNSKQSWTSIGLTIFLKNLRLVVSGFRPGFISETVNLRPQELSKMVHELLTKPVFCAGHGSICILSIQDDNFIINMERCVSHLDDVSGAIERGLSSDTVVGKRTSAPEFVDISKTLKEPGISNAANLTSIANTLSHIVKTLKLPCHREAVQLFSIDIGPDINKCTLFGCLLGYPTIYYFNDLENGTNCLSMVPLKVIKLMCPQSNRPCSEMVILFSFSYPQTLQHEVQEKVTSWKHRMKQAGEGLFVEDVVQLSAVVL